MFNSPVCRILSALTILTFVTLPAIAQVAQVAQVKVDQRLPEYETVQGVAGTIKSVGSDTLNNLMTLWAEKFKEKYPNVQVEIEGKGSSTAPPALIAGASNFGPMSRQMKDAEIDEFEKKFGYKPVPIRASIDMLAVYVHKDNPIAKQGLSLQQVDAIFSKTRKGGGAENITTWGQVGLSDAWSNSPISMYGRNSASGTYGYFKKNALFKGDYKNSVKEQPGSSSVVQGVASDRNGIGYSGLGYKTADVATVALAKKHGDEPIPAEPNYVANYPLARFLMVYVNKQPGKDLDPLRREFIKLIFSQEGQRIVVKDGYLPVSFEIAKKALADVGIKTDS
jgi:phosphate transport system substrate-binding protein